MKNSKYIAFYLPQFHQIPENDIWWGKGFTEWTNTKSSIPLFDGHNQPRIPENNNYYDLTDVDALKWQSKLAADKGVFGFCFYHYWFNGKLLLEKPSEILLDNKDITTNFCFSWANETWSKTWNGQEKNVLISQQYGMKDDWLSHIEYLFKFFKDERYIKVDGHPMLLIYSINKIDCFEEMVAVWNDFLINNGMKTLHLVETLNSFNHGVKSPLIDAKVEFEPWYTISLDWKFRVVNKIKRYVRLCFKYNKIPKVLHTRISYKYITEKALQRVSNSKIYKGAFTDWDNSARKAGTKNPTMVKGSTPELFGNVISQLNKKIESNESGEYIFINAWNEWAEGAYLEPDEKYGTQYIDEIKKNG